MPYQRAKAVECAHRWAFGRNPLYGDFSRMGGDCTNFISQCIHAGGAAMNFTPVTGWYYRSLNDRAPAWTGVEELYRFLTSNRGKGPYAVKASAVEILPGDVCSSPLTGARGLATAFLWSMSAARLPPATYLSPPTPLTATTGRLTAGKEWSTATCTYSAPDKKGEAVFASP